MIVEQAFEQFLLACRADGLRPASVKWYASLLSAFAKAFEGRKLSEISTVTLREYIVKLRATEARYVGASQKPEQPGGLSEATINGHIRALHAFWAWCAREYLIINPMRNIKRPRPLQPTPKAISPADFIQLFESTGNDAVGSRDRAILCFLADTGCRLAGLIGLKLEHLDLEGKRAFVHEKGGKSRKVVYTHYTRQVLEKWLLDRISESEYVFTNVHTGDALTASGVNQVLKRLKKRAGVKGRVNPHSFRHKFATEYIKNGGDVVTLARLLGHSDVSTTATYYAIFSDDELAAAHEKFSPLRGFQIQQFSPMREK